MVQNLELKTSSFLGSRLKKEKQIKTVCPVVKTTLKIHGVTLILLYNNTAQISQRSSSLVLS